MSSLLTGAVFQCGPKDMALTMVLLAIADNADDFGFAFPATETIAVKARCDVRSVYRYLDQLECDGWLRRARKLINGKANAYKIDLSKLGVTLSPDARMSPVYARLLKKHGDSLSRFFAPEKSGDKLPASGDNSQPAQVTNSLRSGDKKRGSRDKGVTLTLNHQVEPSGVEPSTSVQQENTPTPLSGVARTGFAQLFQQVRNALRRALKEDMPGGLQQHRFTEIREGQNDFDTCFLDWWGVDAKMLAGTFTVITEASDAAATEAGLVKYSRRLDMLARQVFSIPRNTPVRFTVRHVQSQTPAA